QKDAAALDKAEQVVRDARAKLSTATLPADATKAADDLEQALASLHGARGDQLEQELLLGESQAVAAAAESSLSQASQQLADKESAQKAAHDDEEGKQKWVHAVGTA